MGFTRDHRGLASKRQRSGRLHAAGVPAQQRIHLTAVLILLLAPALLSAQEDIAFDPTITQEQFHTFTALVGQTLFPTPVSPPDEGGLIGFDLGIAATAIPIDENAEYWVRSVNEDFTRSGYLIVPRLVASKGIGFGNLSASYAQVPDSDVRVIGAALDLPLIRGGLVRPTLVVRATYGQLQGVAAYELTTYGAEVVIGKTFGPITPYLAGGRAKVEALGRVDEIPGVPPTELIDEFEQDRYTAGVRFSMLVLNIAAEVTRAEETMYAVKLSFGL